MDLKTQINKKTYFANMEQAALIMQINYPTKR